MLAYIRLGKASWSIARLYVDAGDLEWWCGEADDWVSPNSEWWQLAQRCWNVEFKTIGAARTFARHKGWEDDA